MDQEPKRRGRPPLARDKSPSSWEDGAVGGFGGISFVHSEALETALRLAVESVKPLAVTGSEKTILHRAGLFYKFLTGDPDSQSSD